MLSRIWNTEYSIKFMDDITKMAHEGWRPGDLAGKFDIPEPKMIALLERNGLPVHARRKSK